MVGNHFMKPLLPEFKSGLDIPLKFYTQHLKGDPHQKTVVLTTDVSDLQWEVKLAGRRFTNGWKDFAIAHDYQVGDMLIFKYSGELAFHVTAMDPNCCEVQYEPASARDRIVHLCVTKDTLTKSRIFLPKEFTAATGLASATGEAISMMNDAGVKWAVKLVMEFGENRQRLRLTVGLADFLKANNITANTTIALKLTWEDATTPVLKLVG